MSYGEFSYFYDEFNDDANYDKLYSFIDTTFKKYKMNNKIIADLGCGTGEISLRLASSGYDVIAVDLSEQMLSVLADKISYMEELPKILILNQDITKLDLFGTINGAVSTFDTFNHLTLEQLTKTIQNTALFMEKDAVFIFDMNTEYKHTNILQNNTYTIEADDAICVWKNTLYEKEHKTNIQIDIEYTDDQPDEESHYNESFYEYYYTIEQITKICDSFGLEIKEMYDGESFLELEETSQRMMFVAVKKYLQDERTNS